MSKSYDLSTSSKWSALSDGEHTVQIVAKADGYRDSAKSTSVTVTKGGSTGETWVLDEQVNGLTLLTTQVNFTSNNTQYTYIVARKGYIAYSNSEEWDDTNMVYDTVSWLDPAYRTITFETAPTGELLTWLQSNGIKQ